MRIELRRTLLDDLALVHEDHAIGHVAGEADLVGDDQHGAALVGQLPHHAQHLADQLDVERRGRLVEQDQLGLHRQHAGDGHALLLAAGQPLRIVVELMAEPDLGEHLAGQFRLAASRASPRTLRGASATFSSAVRCGNRLKRWKTKPISARSCAISRSDSSCSRPRAHRLADALAIDPDLAARSGARGS